MADILFASVKDAVRWAEETVTLPDVKSVLGNLISKSGCGRLTREEVRDIAHTITAIVASVKPYRGQTMQAIFGRPDRCRDEFLACAIADRLRKSEHSQDRDYDQLRRLGLATIKAVRAWEQYGDRFPIKRMAHDVGVSRETFTRSATWRALREIARQQVYEWIEQADVRIYVELNRLGWMA